MKELTDAELADAVGSISIEDAPKYRERDVGEGLIDQLTIQENKLSNMASGGFKFAAYLSRFI